MCNYSGLSFHNRLAISGPRPGLSGEISACAEREVDHRLWSTTLWHCRITRPGKRLQKTMERSSMLSMGKSTSFLWPCSIAMSVYQRVLFLHFFLKQLILACLKMVPQISMLYLSSRPFLYWPLDGYTATSSFFSASLRTLPAHFLRGFLLHPVRDV